MSAIEMRRARERAHDRLVNAAISYMGAFNDGSQQECVETYNELSAAAAKSQRLLYPPERKG